MSRPTSSRAARAGAVGLALLALVAATLFAVEWRTSRRSEAAAGETTRAVSPSNPAPTTGGSGGADATSAPGAAPANPPGPAPAPAVSTRPGLRPVRIQIPAVDVDADLTELGIAPDGTIEVPTDPDEAGWLDTTPVPGQQGPAVIAGHVDSTTGPAVFYRLSSLSPGDEIVVTSKNGTRSRFTVDGLRTYPQNAFPTRQVYGPVPGPALRLITCGGDYDKARGGYQANVVVYAS